MAAVRGTTRSLVTRWRIVAGLGLTVGLASCSREDLSAAPATATAEVPNQVGGPGVDPTGPNAAARAARSVTPNLMYDYDRLRSPRAESTVLHLVRESIIRRPAATQLCRTDVLQDRSDAINLLPLGSASSTNDARTALFLGDSLSRCVVDSGQVFAR